MRSLLAAGGFSEALQLLTLVENDNSLSRTARNITIDSPSEGAVDSDCPKNVSLCTNDAGVVEEVCLTLFYCLLTLASEQHPLLERASAGSHGQQRTSCRLL